MLALAFAMMRLISTEVHSSNNYDQSGWVGTETDTR